MGFVFRKQKKSKEGGGIPEAISIDTSSSPKDKTKRKFSLRSSRNKPLDGVASPASTQATQTSTATPPTTTTKKTTMMKPTPERPLLPKPKQLDKESDYISDGEDYVQSDHVGVLTPESSSSQTMQPKSTTVSALFLPDLQIVPSRVQMEGDEAMEILLGDTILPSEEFVVGEEGEGITTSLPSLLMENATTTTSGVDAGEAKTTTTNDPQAEITAAMVVTPEPSPSSSNAQDETANTNTSNTAGAEARTPQKEQQDNHTPNPITPPMTGSSTNSQTPFDQRAVQKPDFVGGEDPTIREAVPMSERREAKTDVAKKLLDVFGSCNGGSAAYVVEEVKKHLGPTAMGIDIPLCGGLLSETYPTEGYMTRKHQSQCYDGHFAVKFLNELLNEGFTLVYHLPPPSDMEGDESAKEQDWLGRSVTMTLQPGRCNVNEVIPPQLVWKTMGGGMASSVETRSVPLLEIHSIASSGDNDEEETRDDQEANSNNNNNNNINNLDPEEVNCIFTLTTNDGDVHIFESITPEETVRLVRGVKNLTARLSHQLVSGDPNAFADFYTNNGEPDDIRFTIDEAMMRLSHSFFDF